MAYATATTTRAQAKCQQQEDAEREERQEESGAQAHPVEDMHGSHEHEEMSDDTSIGCTCHIYQMTCSRWGRTVLA